MATVLRLKAITGPHRGQRFCFHGASKCTLGRADGCFVQLSGGERDCKLSRFHCQLKMKETFIHVEDLGSRNGTYINGHRVLAGPQEKEEVAACGLPPSDGLLKDGDILTVGGVSFRLDVVACPPGDTRNENEPFWKPGEMAKKNCPIAC